MAIGLIEFRGLAALTIIADEMLKSADIKLLGKKNSGSAFISLLFSGEVSALEQAMSKCCEMIDDIIEFTKISAPASYKYGLGKRLSHIIISKPEIDVYNIFFNNRNNKTINNDINGKALGFIDTKGLIAAVAAADTMVKSFNIEIYDCQRMGSGGLSLVICGRIEDVTSAIASGVGEGKKYGKIKGTSIIANPHPEMILMV